MKHNLLAVAYVPYFKASVVSGCRLNTYVTYLPCTSKYIFTYIHIERAARNGKGPPAMAKGRPQTTILSSLYFAPVDKYS